MISFLFKNSSDGWLEQSQGHDPHVKFDLYVLDLVGGQGVETPYCKKLGGDWYTDSVTDFANRIITTSC